MAARSVKLSTSLLPPKVPGTHFRLMCMTGKNKGVSYLLFGERIIMGRGDDVDIKVLDGKSSRNHAELVKHGDTYVLTDLDSQNGVSINDFKIRQHPLEDADKIVIGKTVFKFNKFVIAKDKELTVPKDDEESEESKVKELNNYRDKHKLDPKAAQKTTQKTTKRKKLIVVAAGLAAVLLLLPEDGKKKANKSVPESTGFNKKISKASDLKSKKYHEQDPEVRAKIDQYIHRGKREFREGNYFRAMEEFNLALILGPHNSDANFYLNKSKQHLDLYIKSILDKGAKEVTQLKYSMALKTYCEVVRLLEKFPEDQRFKDAKGQVEFLEQKLGKTSDPNRCGR